jgi:hypothetical protein
MEIKVEKQVLLPQKISRTHSAWCEDASFRMSGAKCRRQRPSNGHMAARIAALLLLLAAVVVDWGGGQSSSG